MKITVLDTNTITKGDVSLQPLMQFGETEFYDMLTEDEIIEAAKDSDIIICNKAKITEKIMSSCKKLKFVTLFATGYNNIDLVAAKKHGVTVSNAPGYSTDSVAQHTFSFILELSLNLSKYNTSVKNGDWVRSKKFSYFSFPLTELTGKTLGIIGLGTIGQAVAKIAHAFSMRVIAYSRTEKQIDGIEFLPLEEVFKQSDFLTLHCPLTEATSGIINKNTLELMKPSAFIVNTSRGGVIVEEDLVEALKNGTISGAAVDVLDIEPMYENHPYLDAPNMIITPHIAWATIEARTRLIDLVASNLSAFISGKPQNVVM